MATMETTTIKYSWRGTPGDGEGPVAQAVGERLATIEQQRGALKPSFVIEDARSAKSPLHKYFEWDDNKAAEAHRLWQARSLIASVCVKSIGNREIGKPVRAFVNLLPDKGDDRSYENIATVMSHDLKRTRLLNRAKQELAEWRARYDDLTEFADLFTVIDRAVA